jgi:UDP-N-acetylmuramyl pentapeptide phosphotransferase/UDP-N-acetylglucosamine-1-phosphate transferase
MPFIQYILLTVFLLGVFLLYLRLARRLHIIDRPGERSSHSRPTVRGGGVIFPVAAIIWFFLVGWESPWAIAGLSLIALVSFIDDLKPLSGSIRLLVHLLAVGLLFYEIGLHHMYWYWIACALILAIGCINAFNFMDGINGITAGYALVSLGTFSLLNNAGRLLWPVFSQAAPEAAAGGVGLFPKTAIPGLFPDTATQVMAAAETPGLVPVGAALDTASQSLTTSAETPGLLSGGGPGLGFDTASQALTTNAEITGVFPGGAPGLGLDSASGWSLDVPALLGSESFLPPGLVGTVFVAVLVFAFFNARRRALAFAGDVGSISLAFLLSWMMIELMVFTHQAYWLLLFAVYGIDTSVTILIRLSQKKNIFKPHRQHLYQLLANEHGWPHLKVAAVFAAVQGAINLLTIYLVFTNRMNWVVFLVLGALLTVIYTTIRHQATKPPPTTNTQQPTTNNQSPKTNTQHPTSNTQHPTPNTQHPTAKTQNPTTNNQPPTPNDP